LPYLVDLLAKCWYHYLVNKYRFPGGKMMFKKVLTITLMMAMCLSLVACGSKKDDAADSSSEGSSSATVEDLAKIKEKGNIVIGITDFEPMDYKDADGNWVGFDADMAEAFAKSLGVEAKFVEIEWDNKALELESGNIDCVWNGMTLTDEVKSSMDCSNPYCNNAQIVIVPSDKADQYQTEESLKDLNFAVEVGSAGEEQAKEHELKYTSVTNQASALMEVAAGTSDAAIIDSLMAAAMVGEGTSYDKLTYTVGLNSEEYGVGFRKGSDLTEELNNFFKSSYADGSMQKTAEIYGVQAALIEQK
jgi:polar amino acid transport system substrate-binding protein